MWSREEIEAANIAMRQGKLNQFMDVLIPGCRSAKPVQAASLPTVTMFGAFAGDWNIKVAGPNGEDSFEAELASTTPIAPAATGKFVVKDRPLQGVIAGSTIGDNLALSSRLHIAVARIPLG